MQSPEPSAAAIVATSIALAIPASGMAQGLLLPAPLRVPRVHLGTSPGVTVTQRSSRSPLENLRRHLGLQRFPNAQTLASTGPRADRSVPASAGGRPSAEFRHSAADAGTAGPPVGVRESGWSVSVRADKATRPRRRLAHFQRIASAPRRSGNDLVREAARSRPLDTHRADHRE